MIPAKHIGHLFALLLSLVLVFSSLAAANEHGTDTHCSDQLPGDSVMVADFIVLDEYGYEDHSASFCGQPCSLCTITFPIMLIGSKSEQDLSYPLGLDVPLSPPDAIEQPPRA